MRQEDRHQIGRLAWRHAGEHDELTVSSPFGQALAEIVSDPDGARLRSGDGRTQTAASAETLLQAVLGYPLPLPKLVDWVRGRSSGGAQTVLDAQGRAQQVRDQGWRIDYQYPGDERLPAGLVVEREPGFATQRPDLQDFELRLRIDSWQAPPVPDEGR